MRIPFRTGSCIKMLLKKSSYKPFINQTNGLLLCTPFKVGSTSLCKTIEKTFRIKRVWLRDAAKVKKVIAKEKPVILKGHTTVPINALLSSQKIRLSAWITIIRRPFEMIPSCYFQDIDNPDYPYYFGSRRVINRAPVSDLIAQFMAFDWQQWPPISFTYNFSKIRKYTGINLWQKSFDRDSGFTVHRTRSGPVDFVGVIRTDKISDPIALFDFFGKMNLIDESNAESSVIRLKTGNRSRAKWYGRKYESLLSNLPNEYYLKYREMNKQIVDCFYKV